MAFALFSIRFYHQWIALKEEPKPAFQHSVQWLKKTTTTEKITFLDKVVREWIENTIFPEDKKTMHMQQFLGSWLIYIVVPESWIGAILSIGEELFFPGNSCSAFAARTSKRFSYSD